MWLLPSRGRAHLVRRLFEAGISTPGLLLLDDDDAGRYSEVSLPPGWDVIVGPRVPMPVRINKPVELLPAEPWYGVLSDDVLPMTPDWDLKLIAAAGPRGIAWADDNFTKRAVTTVIGGELVRMLGWLHCPVVRHFCGDDCWELIAKHVGGGMVEGVIVSHEHFRAGRALKDRTYRERPPSGPDVREFNRWAKNEWPRILGRLAC